MIKYMSLLASLFLLVPIISMAQEINVGLGQYNNGRSEKEINELLSLAEQGDIIAQLTIGQLYFEGNGVPKDYSKAMKWYRLAAKEGNSEAQFRIGVMYDYGYGFSSDETAAMKWYQMAAQQGHPKAHFTIGYRYKNGRGVPQNYAEAMKWYESASELGDDEAPLHIALMYEHGTGVTENFSEAMKWLKIAAKRGRSIDKIAYRIGDTIFRTEIGTEQRDFAEAIEWINIAAQRGHSGAQGRLAFMYEEGLGVRQNYITAHMWYNIAATNGANRYRENRDQLAQKMSSVDISKAQRRAKTCSRSGYEDCD